MNTLICKFDIIFTKNELETSLIKLQCIKNTENSRAMKQYYRFYFQMSFKGEKSLVQHIM